LIKCIAPHLGLSGKGLNAIIVIHITTTMIKDDFILNNSYALHAVIALPKQYKTYLSITYQRKKNKNKKQKSIYINHLISENGSGILIDEQKNRTVRGINKSLIASKTK
jgi:hypothetical protein